jgi:hypothetical protein
MQSGTLYCMGLLLSFLLTTIFVYAAPLTVQIEALPTEPVTIEPLKPVVLMVDDFEDGEFKQFREWWAFGKVIFESSPVQSTDSFLGKKTMKVNASSNNWYAGGFGVYIGADAEPFSVLKLVLYSPKINSGSLRVELYDDDNNNAVVDINEESGLPSKDDVFIYDVNLVWEGWKVVKIQLKDFVDYNPNVGDNVWNPNQVYGSSGLIQMQVIVLSSKNKSETIEFEIDTIKFN